MNEELKKIYKEEYDVLGYPQEYKGLKIYPIKVCDIDQIQLFYNIFTIPKDTIQDKAIRKMSYLKYLYVYYGQFDDNLTKKIEKDIAKHLSYLFGGKQINIFVTLKNKQEAFDLKNIVINIQVGEEKIILTEDDFENIREIVLEQNGYSIEYINDFRSDLEEKLIWANRENPLTFRDQFFTLASLMSKSPEEIRDWTFFQMLDIFDRKCTEKIYDIYEPLLASGQITLKGERIQPYLYHRKKRGRYDSIFMSPEESEKLESGLRDNSIIK